MGRLYSKPLAVFLAWGRPSWLLTGLTSPTGKPSWGTSWQWLPFTERFPYAVPSAKSFEYILPFHCHTPCEAGDNHSDSNIWILVYPFASWECNHFPRNKYLLGMETQIAPWSLNSWGPGPEGSMGDAWRATPLLPGTSHLLHRATSKGCHRVCPDTLKLLILATTPCFSLKDFL